MQIQTNRQDIKFDTIKCKSRQRRYMKCDHTECKCRKEDVQNVPRLNENLDK